MNYDITFTADGERGLTCLKAEVQEQVTEQLRQIAPREYRHPTDLDFKRMAGCAEGRFAVADGIRMFGNIDESDETSRFHTVGRREIPNTWDPSVTFLQIFTLILYIL